MVIKKGDIEGIKKYVRAANYLSAIQLYLKDNFLLERELNPEDIKPRLLGHWGTCPGINFVYANMNYLIQKTKASMMLVIGPGHGFPALQSNLFMEGTLEDFYPKAKQNLEGIGYIAREFSWPYGFPSHSNPGAPGVILEGGELGYSLSTSYGAILDNPELIVTCLVGDGEAETGPTATAWHLNKFIDPAINGAVLPIVHLNGYKISGPTIYGRMSDSDLLSLFKGYGYDPVIVEGSDDKIYEKMADVIEKSYNKIKEIQKLARKGKKIIAPRFPMIILRTLKGWTGIKELNGQKMEGNFPSHQVVGKKAKESKYERTAVENWFRSYKFEELFDAKKGFCEEILKLVPKKELRVGNNKHAYCTKTYEKLILPDIKKFSEDAKIPGTIGSSSMRRTGAYLNEVFKLNRKNKNFRLFSPDETYSNKLDEVFKTTSRAFVWPLKPWDKDLAPNGRVIEMLSEHSLQGLAQGYNLTGRHMIFASYEAFIEIVSSMKDQYEKFIRVAKEYPWRGKIPSFNYILTSSGWRQEHNGFSHQNPSFIGNALEKCDGLTRVYFPPDGNSALAVLKECLSSTGRINVIVAGKTLEPRWLTPEMAEKELKRGSMIWDFASEKNPDIVFGAVGDYMVKESLAAISIIRKDAKEIKSRFVNVMEITSLQKHAKHYEGDKFEELFTEDKSVIFNYHGYPSNVKALLIDHPNPERFKVHGYTENGSTTTPFDMHVRNKTSRYHLAIEAIELMSKEGIVKKEKAAKLIKDYEQQLKAHSAYIRIYGVDPEEIENWKWKKNI
ncbi:phosphoketolase [Candidatus Pacearchaeota archaeon CG10_big_fil_rev_8_21_14_0_10_31_24]|nr:MAG: phosphoketolase [Candidatus Pacearchaeota archaeon CG10_big_fil_rev_8_21_14_0_10_31_24]